MKLQPKRVLAIEPSDPVNETAAAVMVGATVALAAWVFKAPVWGVVLAGAGAAVVAKVGIDASTASA